jgi:hypothetical protein
MKNKIMAMLVAFALVGSVSAIEINENLSINGFIDGSYVTSDSDATAHDDASLELDEVELDFLFSAGGVSGEIHVDSSLDGTNAAEDDLEIEQAHLSYGLENGLTITVGRYGSALGLEREDPGGLYTFSRAYDDGSGNEFNFGDIDGAYAHEGIRLGYAGEKFGIGLSVHNPVTRGVALEVAGPPSNENDLDVEFSFSFTAMDNLNIGGGFLSSNGVAGADTDLTNINAAYTTGKLLLAAEWSQNDTANAVSDEDAYTVLADYDVSDVLGIAVRYSQWDTGLNTDADRLTIAPNYAITESLGAILEYTNDNESGGGDSDTLAVELTFTF